MAEILFFVILLVNGFISWWNCRVVGKAWKDVHALGSTFDKVLLWCGAIQSAIGFSMILMVPLGFGGVWYMTSGSEPMLTPGEANLFLEWVFSLWYVLIIFPALASGLIIWIHSIRMAIKNRTFSDAAIAGWNTFAMAHNAINAAQNLGGALSNVGDLFGSLLSGKGDGRGKLALLAIAVVVLAIIGGVVITFSLIRYYARKTDSRIEQIAEAQRKKKGVNMGKRTI